MQVVAEQKCVAVEEDFRAIQVHTLEKQFVRVRVITYTDVQVLHVVTQIHYALEVVQSQQCYVGLVVPQTVVYAHKEAEEA